MTAAERMLEWLEAVVARAPASWAVPAREKLLAFIAEEIAQPCANPFPYPQDEKEAAASDAWRRRVEAAQPSFADAEIELIRTGREATAWEREQRVAEAKRVLTWMADRSDGFGGDLPLSELAEACVAQQERGE